MNGEPSQSTEIIEKFVTKFKNVFPAMAIERVDERFTSKMAFQTMIDSGLKKQQRKNKALIDEITEKNQIYYIYFLVFLLSILLNYLLLRIVLAFEEATNVLFITTKH